MGVQETEADPVCHACGTDDVDWLNIDSEDLKEDLATMQETLPNLEEKEKEHEEAHPVD
jgi:hypothetical protein